LAFFPSFMGSSFAHANTCVYPGQEAAVAAAQQNASTEPVVVEINTCGGDDTSYQIPLSVDVTFDGVSYSSVYATTNSVITFGAPDGTYWTYPSTPSISLYSFDWVVYPGARADEHLIIRSSDGGFQVDISARPIWLQNATEPTNIVITAAILSDGTVAMAYTLTGPEYPQNNPRTGVRLNDGSVVDFETYGIQETEDVPDLGSEPTDEVPFTPVNSDTTTRSEDTERETTEDTDRETTEDTDRTPPFIPEGATVTSEGSFVEVVAPEGQRVASAVGYYGDPNDSTRGGEVSSILFELLSGETSATIEVSNETFLSDPAPGTPKVLILLIIYEDIPVETQPSPGENAGSEPQPSTPVAPEPEPSEEPSPEPTIPLQPEETGQPEEPSTEPEEPAEELPTIEPEPTEPPIIEPEEESITSAEELPEELSAEELMQVDLAQIDPTELSEAQAEALVAAAMETFETAEAGSEEYQQALEALFVAAQQDDIVLDESLAAIPLLGDVLGGATELVNFLGNAGADMSPQVREQSEKVVVTAIVAVQAALSAISISGIATTVNIRSGS
jgi:hypothetical protein